VKLGELDVPPPDGVALLGALHAAFTRYVAFPSPEAADAATLWTAATHAQAAWDHATRLAVISPAKRCGKSRLLDVIEATCHDPVMTVNISAAALARSVGDDPPTLLLDEADTWFGKTLKGDEKAETLRGLLNAGHQRNRPYRRWDAGRRQPEDCPTFAMAAVAAIGGLPDTITDRAVVIAMRRRAPGETVAQWRTRRDPPRLRQLGTQVHDWITAHLDELADADPALPIDDRDADNWAPLAAVADLAGGGWPRRARTACLALTGEDEADTSAAVRLLTDLRDVFGDAGDLFGGTSAMHTGHILDALHKIDEAPWDDWYGHRLTARELAKLLRPYGVRSADVKIGGETRKGYRREHLADAWSRYLPETHEGVSATSATSATVQVSGHDQVAGSGYQALPPRVAGSGGSGYQALPATSPKLVTSTVAEVALVADTPSCAECGAPISPLRYAQAGPLCARCEATP
jgi:Protein of unknown function (DUF3631)